MRLSRRDEDDDRNTALKIGAAPYWRFRVFFFKDWICRTTPMPNLNSAVSV